MENRPIRQLVPPEATEKFATVRGHRVRYLTGGSGPSLLLLHGLMGFSFSFSENFHELSQHATFYAPDLLNTGYSERTNVDATLMGVAQQVLEFMDAVGIAKAGLLGSSHGGSVAMAVAARAPQRVSLLILVSPTNPWSETGRMRVSLFSTRVGYSLAPLIRFMPRAVTHLFLKRMYHDRARILPGTVREYHKPMKTPGTMEYLAQVVKSWRKDFADLKIALQTLGDIPMLLLWGTHDPVVSLSSARKMLEHLPNAEFITLNTGHLPYEELPQEFNRAVIDFLLRFSPSR